MDPFEDMDPKTYLHDVGCWVNEGLAVPSNVYLGNVPNAKESAEIEVWVEVSILKATAVNLECGDRHYAVTCLMLAAETMVGANTLPWVPRVLTLELIAAINEASRLILNVAKGAN